MLFWIWVLFLVIFSVKWGFKGAFFFVLGSFLGAWGYHFWVTSPVVQQGVTLAHRF